ncbi:MAG TPA: serine/threonine-protein kinase [Gemmataceae bacterium]
MMGLDTAKSVGNYDLLEKIAEGGMGAIYRGRHRESGQVVAIKIMPSHMAQNPVLLKRFEQEFRAASRLDHANIVRALDYSGNSNVPYLVMEFVEGESLGRKLEREGRLSETDAIRIIAQVAQGLHRAHKQNLIHRDVKPDNILVTPEGIAKLADLGLVKETETDLNLTRTGRGLGTPHFMAPEQFRNAKNADTRCDVYSLGATLYQMVTGELPFRSNGPLDAWMKKIQNELTPPRQLVPALSERIDWAILRAMSADPEKRPASCREFIEDLTGRSTRRLQAVDSAVPQQELWYLVYKDETGQAHTVKGTMTAVRRSLKDGLLGDASNVRAARTKAGPFESLRGHPEFRDLVVEAAPLSIPQPSTPRQTPSSDETVVAPKSSNQETTPAVPRKPNISLDDTPSSKRKEVLKWLCFFALFVLAAAVAYWFF